MSTPPLPPRKSSQTSSISSVNSDGGSSFGRFRSDTIHLTPHTHYPEHDKTGNSPYWGSTGLNDPRSSSTQSLRPVESAGANRRTLLLIYIHGFMGTETSFKSFPAHVHSLLTMTMAETHVIHTKIYPRYQSRKHISFARDAFSNWLQPHESDQTDVVLLGHSLGGILAAEVVLLPSHTPGSNRLFQHRILGQIAYDTPFLGMHPGVVSTGIASLFRGAPDPKEENTENQGSTSSSGFLSNLFEPQPSDPNFNPAFPNDVNLPVRKNKFDRAMYFWNKHSGELRKAAQSYVKSHLEFGGCLADYPGLQKRYNAIRPLEDVDEMAGKKSQNGKLVPRVRFVNYYTASTGRIKEEPPQQGQTLVAETEMTDIVGRQSLSEDRSRSRSVTPRISLEEHTADEVIIKGVEELDMDETEMTQLEPRPSTPSDEGSHRESVTLVNSRTGTTSSDTATQLSSIQSYSDLPSLPPTPTEPPSFDPNTYSDPEVLKLAQKEHERLVKAYERDKKSREKVIKQREKFIAKREKAAEKERAKLAKQESLKEKQEVQQMIKQQEKIEKEIEKEKLKRQATLNQEAKEIEKEKLKRQATLNQEAYDRQLRNEAVQNAESSKGAGTKPVKKQKDRKFCTLPKKDSKTGQRDLTWIRVFMEGMDEVVAHTSLFIVGEAYAKLVGDTAARIEDWVHEDATRRILMNEQQT